MIECPTTSPQQRRRARLKEYRLAHKAERRAALQKWRLEHPGLTKAAQKRSNQKDYAKNRENRIVEARAWARKNPEQYKTNQRRAYLANKAARNAAASRWQRDNPEQRRANHKRWRDANPGKVKALRIRRQSLIRASTSNLKSIDAFIQSVMSKRTVRCYYCEQPTPTKGCHFDHIIPLVKGGPHSVENLCATCPQCNLSKNRKLIEQWVRVGQQVFPL